MVGIFVWRLGGNRRFVFPILLGTPMVLKYVINSINYAIMKRLIQIENIGLVNIIAGKRICEEFVQDQANPESMAK